MKIGILILSLAISTLVYAQNPPADSSFFSFKKYICSIMEDTTSYWSEYPKPPMITDPVLLGMKQEIVKDDSAKHYLARLSFKKFKSAEDYIMAFYYLWSGDYFYSILAMTAHWNPDIRVIALQHLSKRQTIKPLVNSRKMKNGQWEIEDTTALEFSLYLLENNPLFIPGSENATIHEFYMSNIFWYLDLLTGEHIAGKKYFRDWYKNEKQFAEAILQWKSHLKQAGQ
jgi:hypothetical protein